MLRAFRRRVAGAAAAAAFGLAAATHATGAPDLRAVSTEHMEIYTDLGEAAAADVARHLEAAYAVLWRHVFRAGRDPELRLLVMVVRDDELWRRIAPRREGAPRPEVRGYVWPDEARPFLAASLGGARSTVLRSTVHELSHLFMDQHLPFRPFWVSEGLAEYLATMEVTEDALVLGKVPEDRSALLARAPLIPLHELLSFRKSDETTWSPRRADMIYAQSWALVHFLAHGNDGAHRGGFDAYLAALAGDPQPSLPDHVGAPLETIGQDLRFYVKKGLYRFRKSGAPSIPDPRLRGPRRLPAAEADEVLAYALLAAGAPEEARAALPDAPSSPLGALAAARARATDLPGALAVLDASLGRHPGDPFLLLERARVLGDPALERADPTRSLARDRDLDAAIESAPWMAAAIHERARAALRAGDVPRSLAFARRAVALRGGEASYYVTLSQALLESGNGPGAEEVARRALPMARGERARRALARQLDLAEASRRPAPEERRDP